MNKRRFRSEINVFNLLQSYILLKKNIALDTRPQTFNIQRKIQKVIQKKSCSFIKQMFREQDLHILFSFSFKMHKNIPTKFSLKLFWAQNHKLIILCTVFVSGYVILFDINFVRTIWYDIS